MGTHRHNKWKYFSFHVTVEECLSDSHLIESEDNHEFVCDICGKSYFYKDGIKNHMLKHAKPVSCAICSCRYIILLIKSLLVYSKFIFNSDFPVQDDLQYTKRNSKSGVSFSFSFIFNFFFKFMFMISDEIALIARKQLDELSSVNCSKVESNLKKLNDYC